MFFKDGSSTDRVEVQYPIGHRKRRDEGMPVLEQKFESSLSGVFEPEQAAKIVELFKTDNFSSASVADLMELLTPPKADIASMLA